MANTGYIIHPFVRQVFTSGPNSGSEVSSSFNITFDSGSGYTSASICDTEYVYREQDLENCPVTGSCPTPTFNSVTPYACGRTTDFRYTLDVNLSTEADTLYIEYSTTSDFSANVGSTSKSASTNKTFIVNVDDLARLPVSNQTRIYFRTYFECPLVSSSYSPIRSAVCPKPAPASSIRTDSTTSNNCYSCATITVNVPRNSSRTVRVYKQGSGQYSAFYAGTICAGSNNRIASDFTETISNSKTYTIGLSAFQSSNQNPFYTRIIVEVRNGNSVEDTFMLARNHTNIQC